MVEWNARGHQRGERGRDILRNFPCAYTEQRPTITAEEFEQRYAARSGVTVEWLRAHGRTVKPCDCGDEICEGWQSVNAKDWDDFEAAMKP